MYFTLSQPISLAHIQALSSIDSSIKSTARCFLDYIFLVSSNQWTQSKFNQTNTQTGRQSITFADNRPTYYYASAFLKQSSGTGNEMEGKILPL
jgi:hypothetical protein